MITPTDTLILVTTKLRTRRIRTAVTVIIAGLLFATLIASLIVAEGVSKSIHSFSQEGLNNRYIVSTTPNTPTAANALSDQNTIARAQQLYNQMVADKKTAAKKLGIAYDPTTEQSPIVTFPAAPGQPAMSRLNPASAITAQAIQEYAAAHPDPGIAQLKTTAKPYQPTGFYESRIGGPSDGGLTTMHDGQEDFSANDQTNNNGQQKDILQYSQIEQADPALIRPFLLPTQPKQYDASAIPVILPYSKAEQLTRVAPLPSGASAAQKLRQIKTLYSKVGAVTINACYRNSVSQQRIETAINQAAEIAKNQGNKAYQKPSLIYGLPAADSCGPAAVLSDTRTRSEKLADEKQDEFNKMFGQVVDPVQQKISFRVVGLTPDPSSGSSTTIGGLLQSVVGSSLDSSIVIPSDMLERMPNASTIKEILFPPQTNPILFSPIYYYAEFSNATDARNFINDKSCTTRPDGTCATVSKPFNLVAYGSNSIALEDLQRKFSHFFKLATLAVTAIAIVIMAGTVGRMIADGRRETAVFRAIGAKRIDIISIYGLYMLCLSMLTALFALAMGVLAAYGFDRNFQQSATVQAQLLFGASDTTRQFHFFAWNIPAIAGVLVLAVGCGLIGMVLPLLRNVRRSPIKDMREE